MIGNNNDYIFGPVANRPELPPLSWNPDASATTNPHLLITGGSGAGKTKMIVEIAKYLDFVNKHVFMFDLKGDLIIKDNQGNKIGNYINFTAWDSKYGINPFEFDTGVVESELKEIIDSGQTTDEQMFKLQNSGPKVQVERIIEIIKKNFLPNMGTNQKDVLMYLFSDTYVSKGFKYNDINTWLNDLPSLKDTQELIKRIKANFNSGNGAVLDDDSKDFIFEVQNDILGIKSLNERLSDADDEAEVQERIKELREKVHKNLDSYIEAGIENYTEQNICSNDEWFKAREIDFEKYNNKSTITTIEKMSSYINALVDSGVFHSARPPVKNGLNIINISGLDVAVQRFLVDIFLGKIFKSCKIRGTYADRPNKTRGEKCDTFAIIDEAKLISGTSKDKNDPYSYLNRIATESRSMGFGLIVGSQSPEHLTQDILKNFHAQIILKTGIADFDSVRKSFGIDKQLLEFTQNQIGNALVKTGRQFTKVKLEYPQ